MVPRPRKGRVKGCVVRIKKVRGRNGVVVAVMKFGVQYQRW